MSATIRVEKDRHIAKLLIDNPPANVWTEQTLNQLRDIVRELNADKKISALVITGSGEKFFSAGADLKTFASGDKGQANAMARAFGEAFEALAAFEGCSVAAINGYAMGGGLECALACDIRIAEAHAQLALPEASVGLLPCAGGTQRLPWLVGEGWAKRMILCGERVSAAKALDIGLVEEVVESGQALEKALALVEGVSRQSPTSVRVCKSLIDAAKSQPMAQALPQEREAFVDLFDDANTVEGVNAFLEKRTPEWQ